ncbi:hypothetical protein ACROYT_G003925 [Oculina patagonica]
MSPLLYVLVSEVLAVNIRCNPPIFGLRLPGSDPLSPISQYADDTSLILSSDDSIVASFETYALFEKASGSKIKVLGVFVRVGNLEEANWRPRIDAVDHVLASWRSRSLSFRGKALVINALALSRICLKHMMSASELFSALHKDLDYASLNSGKQLQFPSYGLSPERNVTEQQLLHQSKDKNQAHEQTVEMHQGLKALHLQNAQLKGKRATPPNNGDETKQHSHAAKVLCAKSFMSHEDIVKAVFGCFSTLGG